MKRKEVKNQIKQLFHEHKRELIISASIVAGILLVSWGYSHFFVADSISSKGSEKESEVKEVYPQRVSVDQETDVSLNVAGAYSFYYDKEGNGKVLYEKNKKERFPIASISKLMTALVVFENYDLRAEMGVKEQEVTSRTEFRDFRAWSETEVGEMLYPMLIESNNSAAFALALISNRFLENGKDPIDSFVKEMNKKARELGLEKTEFINPSGLDGKNDNYNISTAEEVGKLAKYLLENEEKIMEISQMRSYRLYSPDGMVYYEAVNTNDFLHAPDRDWKKNIVGGKTGWTYAAYGCLLIVIELPDNEGYIVNVVLGAEDRFKEMEKMIEYVHENYHF